jgi:hypothetical protein
MKRIEWADAEGDRVWLRVMYAEEVGGGWKEATEEDLRRAGFVKASQVRHLRIAVLVLLAISWVLFFSLK